MSKSTCCASSTPRATRPRLSTLPSSTRTRTAAADFYLSGITVDGDRGICKANMGGELLGISFEGELLYRIPQGEGVDGFT